MSTPNPVFVAAAPSIISALKAVNQFSTDIGPDPAKWALLLPGAFQKLLGTLEMQIPVVFSAEGGALQTAVTAKVNELIAKVQAQAGTPPA
jgi:hypothetical protein